MVGNSNPVFVENIMPNLALVPPPAAVVSLVPEWVFEHRSATAVSTNPKSKAHFDSDLHSSTASPLMGEGVQNSVDAARLAGEVPVVLRYTRKRYPADFFWNNLMRGVRPHMDAASEAAAKFHVDVFPAIDERDEVEGLLVEDFGTTGLLGSIDPLDWEDEEFRNFGTFWYRQGTSGKNGVAGGRHGIGKSTLTDASDLRLIIGGTRRAQAPHHVLYGQAAFWPHKIEGDRRSYDAYGLFGTRGADGAYPMTGEGAAEMFDMIGFDRRDEDGLSILIPFPKKEITDESLVVEAIRRGMHQICSGHLVVVVGELTIDATTIRDIALSRPEVVSSVPVIDMALDAAKGLLPRFQATRVEKGAASIRPDAFSPQDLAEMTEFWHAGKAFEVIFEVPVTQKGRAAEWGAATIAIRRHDGTEQSHQVMSRRRVTVSHITPKQPYVGILMASQPDILSKFLGDAENVAHTSWVKKLVKDRYSGHSETLGRVKNAFNNLVSALTGVGNDQKIRNAFTNILYTTRKPAEKEVRQKSETTRSETVLPDLPVASKQPFLDRKLSDGFAVARNADREGDFGFRLLAFYARPGGSKKIWSLADFDFADSEMKISSEGAVEFEAAPSGNEILVRHMEPGAVLSVRGFDPNREVLYTLSPIQKD